MPLAFHVTLSRGSGPSTDRRRLADQWRARPLVAVGVGAILAVWVALAYASPPDPSWIPGVYDDHDFDDVVGMATEAAGVDDAQVPRLPASVFVSAALPAVIGMTTSASARAQATRGPPTTSRDLADDPLPIAAPRRSSAVQLLPAPSISSLPPR